MLLVHPVPAQQVHHAAGGIGDDDEEDEENIDEYALW